tara:strand:- start:15853 stop:16077 length:225 start_codon:yes stop_codon:yes gene_type:complete
MEHEIEIRRVIKDKHGYRFCDDDFDLQNAIRDVRKSYIRRALEKTKTLDQAASLLGLKSHQVLSSWMQKLGIKR